MLDKQSFIKPTLFIAGIPVYDRHVQLLTEIEEAVNENPFFQMYFLPGLFTMMNATRDPNLYKRQYMDQRIGELLQSDIVIAHEDMVNNETAFDLGYAYSLGKPILLISKDSMVKYTFEVLHYARLNTIEELSDYNFLKIKKGHG